MTVRTIEDVLADQRAIVTAAEGRTLSDDEATRYEALEAEHRGVVRDAQIRARQAAYEAPSTSALNVGAAPREDDTLERAFSHYMRSGQPNADIVELRSQSVGTNTAGGYTVPVSMRNRITERLKAFGGVASRAEEISTSGGEALKWPTLDDTANSGVIAAEGTAPASGGADLVFATKQLDAYRYTAPGGGQLPLRVSVELLQDSAFDIEGLVTRALGKRIGRAQAAHWVTGTGSGMPDGVTTATAVTTTFTATTPSYAELLAAVHDIDPDYRDGGECAWFFSDATIELIEGVVDANGRPLLRDSTDGVAGAAPRTLLGFPVVTDQTFATYVDGGTNKFGVFGDLRAGYVIRRVKDLTLIVNPYSRANEGEVEYTLWARAPTAPFRTPTPSPS
jgi:HK97 family phage major capsid protein